MDEITIACEVTLKPGNATTQSRLKVTVHGEIVLDAYERDVSDGAKAILGKIFAARARQLGKYAETLNSPR